MKHTSTVCIVGAIVAACFVTTCAAGGNSGALFVETGRTVAHLDTGWRFQFVGSDSSTRYAATALPDSCATVTLPHVFLPGKPGGAPLRGIGWYERDITMPDSMAGFDWSLAFEGVCLRAEVFVDGVRAGGCGFAYMPFRVDISRFIKKDGVVRIAVRVDSRLLPRQIPDVAARGWWIYGGISREVSLVARPKLRIDNVQVRTMFRGGDTFDLHCSLAPVDSVRCDSISVTVVPPGGGRAAAAFTIAGTDTIIRIGGIRAWTPEDPFRYELRCIPYFGRTKGAAFMVQRGFCQLATDGPHLLLNGKPCFLRGIARHDILRLDGKPLTREERRRDLLDIKSMGVNFIRIAHFPQHRDIYELCDSIGLLVMDEIPAWKTDPKFLGSKAGRDYGAAYIRELIAAHGSYTSIVIWSAGNQFQSFKTAVADFVGAVASAARLADPSRLVTFCSYYYIWDKAFEAVDVIAINEYFGWELASLDMLPPMLDKIHAEWPGKPVIVSELGAQAQLGLRNNASKLAGPIASMLDKDISEDHQAMFIAAHMDSIRSRRAFVDGMVVWAYNDYMATMNKKRAPGTPEGFNGCGIVTADRERKLAYDEIRKRYTVWRDTPVAGIRDTTDGR